MVGQSGTPYCGVKVNKSGASHRQPSVVISRSSSGLTPWESPAWVSQRSLWYKTQSG
jgi:hypothetical protein